MFDQYWSQLLFWQEEEQPIETSLALIQSVRHHRMARATLRAVSEAGNLTPAFQTAQKDVRCHK